MRLNLGCGHLPLAGFVNVDSHSDQADVRGDVRLLSFEDVDEVVMAHLLEHLPWRDSVPTLHRIHSWMLPGGRITVEVPDVEQITPATRPGSWVSDMYGSQDHEGEFHRSGFTRDSLARALNHAGFSNVEVRAFLSDHPVRKGMPCLEGTATA